MHISIIKVLCKEKLRQKSWHEIFLSIVLCNPRNSLHKTKRYSNIWTCDYPFKEGYTPTTLIIQGEPQNIHCFRSHILYWQYVHWFLIKTFYLFHCCPVWFLTNLMDRENVFTYIYELYINYYMFYTRPVNILEAIFK